MAVTNKTIDRSMSDNLDNPRLQKTGGLRVWLRKYNVVTHLLILVVMFIVLLPILWLISTSFKDH